MAGNPERRRWTWRMQSYQDGHTEPHRQVMVEGSGDGFDELVVGEWLHLEAMSEDTCYLGIGDRKWMIRIDSKGEPHMGEEYE